MMRNRNRLRLAPPIAAALILSALGGAAGCCNSCKEHEDHETLVQMSEVPAAVQATLNREAAGGKVIEIEKEMKDGKTVYSADIESGGKKWDVMVAEDGGVISKKEE